MGWETIDLRDVSPFGETVPEGVYTFNLLGAAFDERNPAQLNVRAAITTDGEFQGRRMRITYPDPLEYPWSAQALKRLELAIGVDQQPGENVIGWLNRAANATFRATVFHDSYFVDGEEKPRVRAKVRQFSVEPGV